METKINPTLKLTLKEVCADFRKSWYFRMVLRIGKLMCYIMYPRKDCALLRSVELRVWTDKFMEQLFNIPHRIINDSCETGKYFIYEFHSIDDAVNFLSSEGYVTITPEDEDNNFFTKSETESRRWKKEVTENIAFFAGIMKIPGNKILIVI